jgi:hypothetical protein
MHVRLSRGHYTRHPMEPWKTEWNVSRDQYLDMIQALGALSGVYPSLKTHLEDAWWWVKKNWFRISKDVVAPHHVGVFFRALKKKYHYPFIWLTDIVLLINTLIVSFKPPGDTSAKLHNWFFLMQAEDTWPTLFSWLAKKWFQHKVDMGFAMHIYWGTGAPPMNLLAKPIIDKGGW